jgi:tRNA threonylcarbamoyladenosine biosynthesis protein TsaB
MNLLAIDCSASLCAASVYDADADRELGRKVLDLGKGHAEHLMAVIDDAMTTGGISFAELGRIAVSTGPGSFTGIRVGVSAARGLALALGIAVVGVTTLEALALETRDRLGAGNVLAALDGGRGEIQAAVYDEAGATLFEPAVIDLARAMELANDFSPSLAGTAAEMIAAALPEKTLALGPLAKTADIAVYARLAATKKPGERPKPLYLREPDAKPQAGFILPRSGA